MQVTKHSDWFYYCGGPVKQYYSIIYSKSRFCFWKTNLPGVEHITDSKSFFEAFHYLQYTKKVDVSNHPCVELHVLGGAYPVTASDQKREVDITDHYLSCLATRKHWNVHCMWDWHKVPQITRQVKHFRHICGFLNKIVRSENSR